MNSIEIHPLNEIYIDWARGLLEQSWGSSQVVTRGRIHQADKLPGFVAIRDDTPVGLATYCIESGQCELVTLNSIIEGIGVGGILVDTMKQFARPAGCKRLWLITTNDNTRAIRFYQKRGFAIAAFHRNALVESRRLKPEIPLFGFDGIQLRDEIEMEVVF